MRQQFPVDEIFGVVDDHHHDGLRYEVTRRLRHDSHVGIHKITDRLHLTLQLRVHAARARCIRVLKQEIFNILILFSLFV